MSTKKGFPLPRGMRDIGVEEMAQRLWINSKIMEIFERYGFQLVEPSPIESLETLEAKCGPTIKDEIYWFEDKAGRKLGLRFDLTVGLARMVASRPDLTLPVKLAAISNMWRYDEPQFGRYRCFYQWDAEIFGSMEAEADAEIVSLSIDILKNVGLKTFEVRISNRKLVEGFLNSLDIKREKEVEATLRIIDKYKKISKEDFVKELDKNGLNQKQIEKILDFISISSEPEKALLNLYEYKIENEKFLLGLEELKKLVENLKALKKIEKCYFDMSIVRGIGYYDGTVFEIYDKVAEDVGAIVAGGRYNELCKIFGRDLPATGVAGGIERLMLVLDRNGLLIKPKPPKRVFVASTTQEVRGKTLELVEKLRSWGIPVDFDLRKRSLTRQLEYANKLGFTYVLIVGERELAEGKIKVRNMEKNVEEEVSIEKLRDFLKFNYS